jgi:hypothetical protein
MPEDTQTMTKASLSFKDVLEAGRALDFQLPNDRVIEDAYTRAYEASEPWLLNHVVRSWLYSVALAQARNLSPDQELLAVAVLLHDLGLAQGGAPDRRFEVAGADLGRDFAVQQGMGERRSEIVWDSIALHTTASIAHFKSATVACCQSGIACDYGGLGLEELPEKTKQVILAAYPRLRMKDALITCLCGIAKNYPSTTIDNFVADFGERYVPGYQRPSPVELLLHSPFSE